MVLFQNQFTPKYQLLDNPRRKCNCVAHSWAIFGLIVLSISITIISLIIIWDQIKKMQLKTETLDYVLFGPKRKISDIVRFSEYRALSYALANTSVDNIENKQSQNYIPNDSIETFQHVEKAYSLVCYYGTPNRSSSQNRLYPQDIDPHLCTHIIIAFASLNNNSIHFSETDIFPEMKLLKTHNPNLKVLLSVVSFSLTEGDVFGIMVLNKENRKLFIDSALTIMKTYSLDGIDLDWEFPSWPPSNNVTEKTHFIELLKEMRDAFHDKYMITVAVAAPFTIIQRSYDIPKIALYVDFVNIMCYDYHSFIWYYPVVGPNAPLYAGSTDKGYIITLNVNFTVNYWLKNGMPRNKIMLGMPTYGHSWTLMNPEEHDIGATAEGFGSIGDKGFVSYREVCAFITTPGTTVKIDGDMRVPYAYQQREWFSYDDPKSLSYKAEYITELGLAGAMIFSLNHDDFEGMQCTNGIRFPLITRIKEVLMDDNL